jgi:hypothetical protein
MEADMADNPIPLKPKTKAVPEDALDVDSLWLDPALGDGLVDVHYHDIPVGKPREFFRVNPDPAYRRMADIYTHKVEGQVDEQNFIIDEPMRGVIEEARRCTLVTVVYRDGSPRLWPLKLPKDSERDNDAWSSARSAARAAMGKWVRLVWQKRSYVTREAQPGYAPEPDWTKLPSFNELIRLGFGESGIIRDKNHRVVLDLFGAAPQKADDDADGLS